MCINFGILEKIAIVDTYQKVELSEVNQLTAIVNRLAPRRRLPNELGKNEKQKAACLSVTCLQVTNLSDRIRTFIRTGKAAYFKNVKAY